MSEEENQINEEAWVEPESETVTPAPTSKRRVAHYINPDRRAIQRGPLSDPDTHGRQSREPCYETQYIVRCAGGLRINERLYVGRVTVCDCVANYLSQMDREWERAERDLFRNNSVQQNFEVGR